MRITEIQALRALAALLVVVYHAKALAPEIGSALRRIGIITSS